MHFFCFGNDSFLGKGSHEIMWPFFKTISEKVLLALCKFDKKKLSFVCQANNNSTYLRNESLLATVHILFLYSAVLSPRPFQLH